MHLQNMMICHLSLYISFIISSFTFHAHKIMLFHPAAVPCIFSAYICPEVITYFLYNIIFCIDNYAISCIIVYNNTNIRGYINVRNLP